MNAAAAVTNLSLDYVRQAPGRFDKILSDELKHLQYDGSTLGIGCNEVLDRSDDACVASGRTR